MSFPQPFFKFINWPNLREPTSSLRCIKIRLSTLRNATREPNDAGFELFTQGLAARLPRLESLILHSFNFNFSQCNLPSSLTSLCITNERFSRNSYNCGLHIGEVLAVLQKLPQLAWLDFERALPPLTNISLPTVSVPNILRLQLVDFAALCGQLLDHLQLPSTAQLHVNALIEEHDGLQVDDVAPAITSQMTALTESLREVQIVDNNRHKHFEFLAWRSASSSSETQPYRGWGTPFKGDVRVAFSLENRIRLAQLLLTWDHQRLDAMFVRLPLTDVSSLKIEFTLGHYIDIPQVYAKMNRVQHLSIVGEDRVQVQTSFTKLLGPSADGTFLFPALQTVRLKGIDFADRQENGMLQTIMQTLLQALLARRDAGVCPTNISLYRCARLSEEDIRNMSEYVEIDWDWDQWERGQRTPKHRRLVWH